MRQVNEISADIPLFTVHDSIIITEQYAPVLKHVLLRKYTGILGFPPPIKREPLNGLQADLENRRYVKGKIDQAEIEGTENQPIPSGMLSFLKCEHWNIDIIIREMTETKRLDLGEIPGVPNIKLPKQNCR